MENPSEREFCIPRCISSIVNLAYQGVLISIVEEILEAVPENAHNLLCSVVRDTGRGQFAR